MKMYLLAAQEQSIVPTLVMFGGIFLVMYFFMIRPQQKKQKEMKKNQKTVDIKEVQLSPVIQEHDIDTKVLTKILALPFQGI